MIESGIKFSRVWAMPNPNTFEIEPIRKFVNRYMTGISMDPFARNSLLATHRNDLNSNTKAEYHLVAPDFLELMALKQIKADVVLLDMPYSPRQISECYAEAGLECRMADTQNSALYKKVRDAVLPVSKSGTIVLGFGWNTVGMGKDRGFSILEIMLCCHGGAHNDTICMAEIKDHVPESPFLTSEMAYGLGL